jgi:uncharacterized sodium:solute symporter family permease YidK
MSNTIGATSEAGAAYPSEVHEFTPISLVGFVSLVICVVFLCTIICLFLQSNRLFFPQDQKCKSKENVCPNSF